MKMNIQLKPQSSNQRPAIQRSLSVRQVPQNRFQLPKIKRNFEIVGAENLILNEKAEQFVKMKLNTEMNSP